MFLLSNKDFHIYSAYCKQAFNIKSSLMESVSNVMNELIVETGVDMGIKKFIGVLSSGIGIMIIPIKYM